MLKYLIKYSIYEKNFVVLFIGITHIHDILNCEMVSEAT